MRKIVLLGMVLATAATLLAQTQAPNQAPTRVQLPTQSQLTPLSVNTGLWQVTMTTTIKGMPNPIVNSYRSCIKKEDLGKYPFTDPKAMCSWTVVSSTGTQMNANGTCMPAGMGTVQFNMQLNASDSSDVTGTGQMSFNGPAGAMTGNYAATAKWVGANCPAPGATN